MSYDGTESDGADDSETADDTREMGIEFGSLKRKLDEHDYPATGEELLAAYGDHELELPGGSTTLREVLGQRRSQSGDDETIEYESGEDVRQSITNMVGAEAVGRKGYSDRGGSMQDEIDEGAPDGPDSV